MGEVPLYFKAKRAVPAVGSVSVAFWTAITDYFKAKHAVLLVTVRTHPPRTVP